jgi:uncharacterized protein YecE (DUF72 family)
MILVGMSGYDYGDWVGPFYPEGTWRENLLAIYGNEFGMIELVSTYSRLPAAEEMAALPRQVPAGFQFSALVHHSLVGGELAEADRFREGLRPLDEARQLACVVATFGAEFRYCQENRDQVLRLRDALCTLRLVVEFTSGSWIVEGMSKWLRANGMSYCCVDLPRLPGLAQPLSWVTGPIAYVRFHGRNREAWQAGTTEAERRDYRYDGLELAEWLPKIEEMDKLAALTLLCHCNTPRAQAVESARTLRRMVTVE